jgi:predicted metal-binding membrane protein
MLILLALGAMNLVFMLMVTAMIAMEKLLPKPKLFVRTAGIIAAGAGTFMMVRLLS